MVEPGTTVEAGCWWDIEQAVPSEQYPDLCAHHNKLLDERRAAYAAFIESLVPDEDEATDEVCGPEFDALQEFAGTMTTTLAGLLAMIVYAGECFENNPDAFEDSQLIEHLPRQPKRYRCAHELRDHSVFHRRATCPQGYRQAPPYGSDCDRHPRSYAKAAAARRKAGTPAVSDRNRQKFPNPDRAP